MSIKIAIIGGGYVGLVSAACFADFENKVFVVEKDKLKLAQLKQGIVPFYEPGLDILVNRNIKTNNLSFSDNIEDVIEENISIFFICVGTPSNEDGSPNLSYVFQAAHEIGKLISHDAIVVNKSTVPVGTADKVQQIINQQIKLRNININIDVASNPEFLKEGDAIEDFLKPDRVIIGTSSQQTKAALSSLYLPIVCDKSKILVMSRQSAELSKYGANSLLATKISFMNQMAILAERVGADIKQIQAGIGSDKRIGKDFLNAGIGYGGSCFPKDVQALIHMGKQNDCPMSLVCEVEAVNQNQRKYFIDKIAKFYDSSLKNKVAGIWGLSFKPETDDIRCAPSIDIINNLLNLEAKILVYDPIAESNIKKQFGDKIEYAQNSDTVIQNANFLIILTEWKEFLNKKPQDFQSLKDKVIFDGRNCFDPLVMKNNGLTYICIGRQKDNLCCEDIYGLNINTMQCPSLNQ